MRRRKAKNHPPQPSSQPFLEQETVFHSDNPRDVMNTDFMPRNEGSTHEGSKSRRRATFAIVSIYSLSLLILFVGCAISGVFVGLLVTEPTLVFDNQPSNLKTGEKMNFWSFEGSKTSVKMTGVVSFMMALFNASIFTLQFYTDEISFYFYPIGSETQCLLYHSGIMESSEQPPFQQRILFIPPQSSFKWYSESMMTNKNNDRTRKDANPFYIVDWRPLFDIPLNRLPEIKSLWLDCMRYGMIVVSAQVTKGGTLGPLAKVPQPGPAELFVQVPCTSDNEANNSFRAVTATYQKQILSGVHYIPSIW